MAFKSIVAAALVLGSLTAPALADSTSSTTPAPTTKTNSNDPNKVICRRIETIGSRLDTKRICRTRAEWEAEQQDNRQALERSQTQNWKNN